MVSYVLLISIFVYFSETFAVGLREIEFPSVSRSSECKVLANASAQLDSAIELIKSVRDSERKCSPTKRILDCEDILRRGYSDSGVYKVFPQSRIVQKPIEVYCDMDTDGGGWTVIQRRGNFLRPIDYFYKGWQSYKKGFGDIEEDFWLGNENIFALSNQKQYSARFDLRDVEGNEKYALYDTFWIDSEENKYMLHILGYSGTAGDSMIFEHNGKKFTTKDQKNDNEKVKKENCAEQFKGGWWYNHCHQANLNGSYLRGKHDSYADGVNWYQWKAFHESLEWTEIKIRSRDFKEYQDNKYSFNY